jgi:hypothetical protein
MIGLYPADSETQTKWSVRGLRWDHRILFYHDQPVCPSKHQAEIVPATVFLKHATGDTLGRCKECYLKYKKLYAEDGYEILSYDEFLVSEVMQS